jgi:DNA (cytosine-5)-methyltransferase 1
VVTGPTSIPLREDLNVPDRFEGLSDAGSGALRTIIAPVHDTLELIDQRFVDMRSARRGGLMILRGESGAGKSTFLNTVGLFRSGVVTERISGTQSVPDVLAATPPTGIPRIIVLEGREALGEVSRGSLEEAMHAINTFVRSAAGRDTLAVWPTNTDDLTVDLADIATTLGHEALFGTGEPFEYFTGPKQSDFVEIASKTVASLNEGASLAALGVSDEQARELVMKAPTIGRYLALIRQALIENGAQVRGLLASEQYRMWTVVVAGNDPEGDVAALTRGGYAYADVDRLLTATGANIVKELKRQPDRVGILGTVLDARILQLDMLTVLAVARQYGDGRLHDLMRAAGMSTQADASAAERLTSSELGLILSGGSLGTRRRGKKPGGGTETAFKGLAEIARTNDGACNAAIGAGLQEVGLIDSFETEKALGTDLVFLSDLYVTKASEPLRFEIMWRKASSRAQIANYVLGKLGNYGRAVGLLD